MPSRRQLQIVLALCAVLLVVSALLIRELGAAGWAAFFAFLGAVLTSCLGTYTSRDQNGVPREEPGVVRAWLLGDGTRPVSPGRWRGFLIARGMATFTLLAGFALALWMGIDAWADAAEQKREMHVLRQNIDLLYSQPSVAPEVQEAYRQNRR